MHSQSIQKKKKWKERKEGEKKRSIDNPTQDGSGLGDRILRI